MHYPSIYQHTHAKWEVLPPKDSKANDLVRPLESSPFPPQPNTPESYPPITPYLSRNATTIDTVFAAPPTSTFGLPGPTGLDSWGLGTKGLVDVSDEIVGCLEGTAREEFLRAREKEIAWRMSWSFESLDGARRVGFRR